MPNNRFEGSKVLLTADDRKNAKLRGISGEKLQALSIIGQLSENGLGLDTEANENYSGTQTFFSYQATANSVIHKVLLTLEDGNLGQNAITDHTLFLGGGAVLTNGIVFGVASVAGSPDLFSTEGAKSVKDFSEFLGADTFRDVQTVSSSAANNTDTLYVTIDFEKTWGLPLYLSAGELVGFYLQDNLSGLSSLTGSVFGRLV